MAGAAAWPALPLLYMQTSPKSPRGLQVLKLGSAISPQCKGTEPSTWFAAYSVSLSSSAKVLCVLIQVHKFGGTCVSAAERICEAAQLVVDEPAQCKLVVVSAMGSHPSSPVKVTDLLLNMVAKASQQDQAFLIDLAALQARTGCYLVVWRVACWTPSEDWLEAALAQAYRVFKP